MAYIGQRNHAIYLLEQLIQEAEDDKLDAVEMPFTVADLILSVLESQEVKEPLEDVVFFTGKPTMQTLVYHALVRTETLEIMRKDPNIAFCVMSKFNGHFDTDTPATLEEQENQTRAVLEGRS